MKKCSNHLDRIAVARGFCHSCYQGWRRKNTLTGKLANRRNKPLEVKRRKAKNIAWLNELKSSTPCTDCTKYYPPWCMHFDHLFDKLFNISVNRNRTLPTLQREIEKCQIVCCNCHATRTRSRLGPRKYTYPQKERNRERVNSLKEATPCKDCGTNYPYWCMQFDHVRGTKLHMVGSSIYTRRWDVIQQEMDKCELVCGNCHAHRTQCRLLGVEHYLVGGLRYAFSQSLAHLRVSPRT